MSRLMKCVFEDEEYQRTLAHAPITAKRVLMTGLIFSSSARSRGAVASLTLTLPFWLGF